MCRGSAWQARADLSRLRVTYAGYDYDRVQALIDGSVQPAGVDLNYMVVSIEDVFWRMLRYREFDACELSCSSYLMAKSRGELDLVAIPVFPSRMFRHSSILVNPERVKSPKDLEGKKIGLPEYQLTACLWARAILQHEYGVALEAIQWFTGGEFEPGREEKVKLQLPPGIRVQPIAADKALVDMAEQGELDGLIAPRMPPSVAQGKSRLRRLFPNYRQEEQAYYRRTGIFPIMHMVVIRGELVRDNPWLPASLFQAFERAKDKVVSRLGEAGVVRYTLPWMLSHVEEQREILGPDPWPYGLPANFKALDCACEYSFEQGLSARRLRPDELFHPSTIDPAKV